MSSGSLLTRRDESVEPSESIRLMTLRQTAGQQQGALGSQEEQQTDINTNSHGHKEDVCSGYQRKFC